MRTWPSRRTIAAALTLTAFLLCAGALARAVEHGSSSQSPAQKPTGQDHTAHSHAHGTTVPPAASPADGADSTLVSWFAGGTGLYTPPYYDSFKGLDLASLTPVQKERFLHWVNTEFCSCNQTGCTRDTIANCYTNDAACPRAPVRIREILEKVKGGATPPGAPASAPAAQPPAPGR